MRLIRGFFKSRIARPGVLAIEQNRHEDLASVFGQTSSELTLRRQARCQPADHLWCFIGIRNGNDTGDWPGFRLKPKALGKNILKYGPTHGMNCEKFRFADERWIVR